MTELPARVRPPVAQVQPHEYRDGHSRRDVKVPRALRMPADHHQGGDRRIMTI